MNRFQLKLNQHLIDSLLDAYQQGIRTERLETRQQLRSIPKHARKKWLEQSGIKFDRRLPKAHAVRHLFDFLVSHTEELLDKIEQLKRRNVEFRNAIGVISSTEQRDNILQSYTQALDVDSVSHRGVRNFLNDDAANDYFIRIHGELEQGIAFAMERIGHVAAKVLESVAELQAFWERTSIEQLCQRVLVYEGDTRVNVAGLKCISLAIANLPTEVLATLLCDPTRRYLRGACLDRAMDVWLQNEAFSIVAKIAPDELPSLVHTRLSQADDGDDMFVRRHAVSLLTNVPQNRGNETTRQLTLASLLRLSAKDRKPFVRQQVVIAAVEAPPDIAIPVLEELALGDECEKVRAATLVGMLEFAEQPALQAKLLEFVHVALNDEPDEFVLRTSLLVAYRYLDRKKEQEIDRSIIDYYQNVIVPDMLRIESSEKHSVPMRRWSAQARERVWLALNAPARQLHKRLMTRAQTLAPGRAVQLPSDWLRDRSSDLIGRVLAVMAQDDFGYDLERTWFGYRLVRGPIFRFRFWRFWFELVHRATDKRQAFQHTIGRWSEATIRAPSQIMGELSQTKVPGEPYLIASDGTWRPFLPLVDDLISSLQLNWFFRRPIRLYSSQGVTEVVAPQSLVKMILATWRLHFRFPKFAQMRNWEADPQSSATAYIDAVQKLGFTIQIRPHAPTAAETDALPTADSRSHDPSVLQFFPCIALFAFVMPDFQQLTREYARYFSSAYENSLSHLVIFVTLFLLFFVGKHLVSNIAVRRARQAIPLSLGGWGTRGKSGTERLKAALIGAMGYGLVSKTTGCEAMFIQAHAFGEPLEIPLFRPYDKATIWEQANLLKLSAKLKPAVFLWECMGLSPAYVEVLSRQWTCDDMATITNTYPDHEDLQGPTGYDVATTISDFVPMRSHVITTEEEMRPLVTESCRRVGTTLRGVGWLESGLITEDVQDRFPYKEHPNNIALVAAMGDELGVPYEFSVKAMADYLVPDLGVLKVYPVSQVRTRRIEFTNGMSANERFGCMGNWNRLGFDQCQPDDAPDTWVSAVINNRADRVARSRVFASIMVHDISVDRFFLIGNNLTGLQGFVEEAWEEREKRFLLCEPTEWNKDAALSSLNEAAKAMRQPTTSKHVEASLRAMLTSCLPTDSIQQIAANWDSPDAVDAALRSQNVDEAISKAINKHQIAACNSLKEYRSLKDSIASSTGTEAEALNSEFQQLVRNWFMRKLVVIENYDATGEEVVASIVDETPPGFLNRTMGMQNIKGTGLDFIYRFQAWDACYNACQQLKGVNLREAEKGLQSLAGMPAIGQLCEAEINKAISVARKATHLQRADIQAELTKLEKRIGRTGTSSYSKAKRDYSRLAKIKNWMYDIVEQFVDANDAISRRRSCDRIYRELHRGRLSRQAAVEKLRKINKRQKGGWLR